MQEFSCNLDMVIINHEMLGHHAATNMSEVANMPETEMLNCTTTTTTISKKTSTTEPFSPKQVGVGYTEMLNCITKYCFNSKYLVSISHEPC
jgi:hypothetical protein